VRQGLSLSTYEVQKNYIKAVGKGILKVMSKMGISTYQSYCGAQIFDAVGLSSEFIAKYFTGTATTIEGVGLAQVAEETVRRHAAAYGDNPIYRNMLDVGGIYGYRIRGEDHAWTPNSVSKLQHAVRGNNPKEYEEFARSINEQSERLLTIRGLMDLKPADKPLDISAKSKPRSEIVKRFATGAMSYGSISWEAHTTLAAGDEPHRRQIEHRRRRRRPQALQAAARWVTMRSAIKQVASGPLWRDGGISGQCRRYPDQDGAGCKAW
jgi:glutamate synthase (NADPH/NADH) large chain